MEAWRIDKPVVTSNSGVVVSQHRSASEAGAQILAEGGNAVDAVIATAACLGVVEPWLSGIGGGGFLLAHDAASGRTHALDFGMVAPRKLRVDDYPLADTRNGAAGGRGLFGWPAVEGDRNVLGGTSIGVPGAVAGFGEALARLGTMSWRRILAPAIAHARTGLEVDWYVTLSVATAAAELATDPASRARFLPGGVPPLSPLGRPPTRLPLDELAGTLERLADEGPDAFYRGELAASIVDDLRAAGCRIEADDLASYRPQWREPARARFAGADVEVMPGLTGGPTLLETLAGIERRLHAGDGGDGRRDGRTGPAPHVALADALQEAYRRRFAEMGAGDGPDSCTTHVSVVDRHGNVAALTTTLLARFGSKVTLPTSGVLMNNALMWFDTRPGRPNSIRPGARPLANMCPTIVTADDGSRVALGAAGGRRIVPALANVLTYALENGDDWDVAVRRPRLDASGATVEADPGLAPDVRAAFEERFDVRTVADAVFPSPFAVASLAAWRPATNGASPRAVGVPHRDTPWPAAVAPPDDDDDRATAPG